MLNEGEKFYRRSILRQAEKVINTLKLPVEYKPIYWTEFRRQTIELDILRNQSFADTFPELEEIYNITKIIKPNIEQKKLI